MHVNMPETPELLDLLHTLDNLTTSSTLVGRCLAIDSDDPETYLYVRLKIEL